MQGNEDPLDELLSFPQDGDACKFSIEPDKTSEGYFFTFIFCLKTGWPTKISKPDRGRVDKFGKFAMSSSRLS